MKVFFEHMFSKELNKLRYLSCSSTDLAGKLGNLQFLQKLDFLRVRCRKQFEVQSYVIRFMHCKYIHWKYNDPPKVV